MNNCQLDSLALILDCIHVTYQWIKSSPLWYISHIRIFYSCLPISEYMYVNAEGSQPYFNSLMFQPDVKTQESRV